MLSSSTHTLIAAARSWLSVTLLLVLVVTSVLTVIMMLSVRHTIAAFAQLRASERKNGVRYFGNIEKIHA
ncbi:hypothetical protein [Pseudomonas sp. NBRC 100443]|uniref:hypothetical protein n=1 Tax=Pseudomonas sp. NBRC 100443 TaxID=1113665 RepID=UPI0024A2420E|nr:hypothetical protein [Pseudomonas sp. NBRC 100443]GLU39999.1 hypothetical protein Pssp01_40920 [Pseudomonas sp. NBRC 100443]